MLALFLKKTTMARIEFLQDICGVPKGTKKEIDDPTAKRLEKQGLVKIIRESEKVEKIEPKQAEKVETKNPVRKPIQRK